MVSDIFSVKDKTLAGLYVTKLTDNGYQGSARIEIKHDIAVIFIAEQHVFHSSLYVKYIVLHNFIPFAEFFPKS